MNFIQKVLIVIGSLGIFAIAIGAFDYSERQLCMGIPLISEQELEKFSETDSLDISHISYNGEAVAVDFPSNTIYFSASFDWGKELRFFDLKGKITPINPEYSLYFLKTENLHDVQKITSGGAKLTLIIICENMFQRVNAVLTTLPVVYLDVEYMDEDNEGREVVKGKFTIWSNEANIPNVNSSYAEWRIRGNSTRIYPKKAWKLNLRDEIWNNKNIDLLGMGSDDDWILNPMSMDDTKVKEKFIQTIWNHSVKKTYENDKMSEGEYIELTINGAYQGLYLLQRRIDTKFLNMNRSADILLKGKNIGEVLSVEEGYEIVSSPLEEEQTYEVMEKILNLEENYKINLDKFVDVSLLLQLISGKDNSSYKNMFYAINKTSQGYELSLIPWDTDLSLGVDWGYSYEECLHELVERKELEAITKIYPDIHERISKRWKELRKNAYSEENLLSVLDEISDNLYSTGAIQRDMECWEQLHGGQDNLENLYLFIEERVSYLDEYYGQK